MTLFLTAYGYRWNWARRDVISQDKLTLDTQVIVLLVGLLEFALLTVLRIHL